MRKLFLIMGLLSGVSYAHDVVWPNGPLGPGNPLGTTPENPIKLRFIGDKATVSVQPVINETCTVVVNLDPIISTAFSAIVNPPAPAAALKVDITVTALREPLLVREKVQFSGEWHATGLPLNSGCNAVAPNRFTVPVTMAFPISFFQTPNIMPVGDPVSTLTGEVVADSVDLSLGGPLPLSFARHYGSVLDTSAGASALGPNWMHNFDQSLFVSGVAATVVLFPGKAVQFQQSGGSWQVAAAEMYNYQLVSSGATFQFLDPPSALIYTFSSTGALTGIRDRNGNALTVTPGPAGPLSVTDGLGRTLTFTYAANLLSSVRDQTGRAVTFTHAGNNLTAATDAGGQTRRYNYAAASDLGGQLNSALYPAGNTPWTQSFDTGGRVVRQTDSVGNSTSISFDQPSPRTRRVTDPLGRVSTYTYDASGNLTQYTDAAGQSLSFTFDANSRLTSRTDSLGNKTTIGYHAPSGYPASITDADGNTTSYTYTAQTQGSFTFYNLTKVNLPDGTSISRGYDGSGNLVSSTDRAGKVTAYTYNSRGQELTATNPAGGVTAITYNTDGTVATARSPAGDVTTFVYDTLKRGSQIRFADNTSQSFTYDALDRPLSRTDERGKATKLAYDANGNVTSVADALNQTATATYDTDDLVSSLTDQPGKTSKVQYDELGAVKAVTDAAGQTVSFNYDAVNRLQSAADNAGKGPTLTYDSEGRLVAVANALSNTVTMAYDRIGRAIRLTTPLGENIDRAFDALGRLTSFRNPLSQVTSFSYDSRGLLARVSGPEGIAASYAFDDLGRLSGVTDPNGSVWSMKHDNSGRLTSRTDPLGRSTTYTYDPRNRRSGAASTMGSVQFTYDAAGNGTQRRFSDGTVKSFTYNDNNQVTGGAGVALAYDAAGRMVSSNGLAIARDAAGRIASITYAPGKTVAYAYDSRGLLAQVSDWAGGSIAFAYDDAARLVSMSRSNGTGTQFLYDNDSRMAAVTETAGDQLQASIALTRDAAGNVTSADRNLPQAPAPAAGVLTLGYDAAHQVSGASYDSLGRLTGDGPRSYTWNLASELNGYSGADGSASFGYDAFGLRTSVTAADGATQNYALNYALSLPSIATVKSGSADQRYYVYLPSGALLYAIEAADNSHRYYHFDEIGSTTFLTDDGGAVTDRYGVTPYGETVTATGATPNPFTWLGRWGVMQEGSTGLYYMRLRYYDSAAARFLSRDPLLQLGPKAIDPYQYASANPMSFFDPAGLKGGSANSLFGLQAAGDAWAGVFSYWGLVKQAAAASAAARAAAIQAQFETFAFNMYTYGMETGFSRFPYGWFKNITQPEWWVEVATEDEYMKIWEQELNETIAATNEAQETAKGILQAEQEIGFLAKSVRFLNKLGTAGIIVVGIIQSGYAIYQDVKNNASALVTVSDAMGYIASTGAILIGGWKLAALDLVTGGGVTGGVHNFVEAGHVIPKILVGRVTSQESEAIKQSMSRPTWATKKTIFAGEYYANTAAGEAVTDFLGKYVFSWF